MSENTTTERRVFLMGNGGKKWIHALRILLECGEKVVLVKDYQFLLRIKTLYQIGENDIIVEDYNSLRNWRMDKTDDNNVLEGTVGFFSSGTSGIPKLVFYELSKWQELIEWSYSYMNLNKRDKVLIMVPCYHILGFFSLIGALANGNDLIFWNNEEQLSTVITNNKPEIIIGVPQMLYWVARVIEQEKFSCLRTFVCGGAMIDPFKLNFQVVKNIEVISVYGMTECPIVGIAKGFISGRLVYKLAPKTKMRLENREIVIESPFCFAENALYSTGDIGSINELGFCVHGRVKNGYSLSNGITIDYGLYKRIAANFFEDKVEVSVMDNRGGEKIVLWVIGDESKYDRLNLELIKSSINRSIDKESRISEIRIIKSKDDVKQAGEKNKWIVEK